MRNAQEGKYKIIKGTFFLFTHFRIPTSEFSQFSVIKITTGIE